MRELLTNVRAPKVARARRLLKRNFRKDDRAFLAEGPQAAREAAKSGNVRTLFITPSAAERYPDVVQHVENSGGEIIECTDTVIAEIASTVTPQGMVAVVASTPAVLEDVINSDTTLAVLMAYVRDPGNAGAAIRVSDAVGATGVILSTDSVDAHNPKVVRSSAGSNFHIPVVEEVTVMAAVARARECGLQILVGDGSGTPLTSALNLSAPTLWIFGNEAWGVPQEVLDLADQVVSLPIYGQAESLNLATATAVCLYASANAQHATDSQ